MVLLSLQGSVASSSQGPALGQPGASNYAPTLREVQRMRPRPMIEAESAEASQAHEEWTETVYFPKFGVDTFGAAPEGGFGEGEGARVFTLPANPGTELIEVIIHFDQRTQT